MKEVPFSVPGDADASKETPTLNRPKQATLSRNEMSKTVVVKGMAKQIVGGRASPKKNI